MPDSWRHAKMNDLLFHVGRMDLLFNNSLLDPLLDKEYFFPLMHFQVAINQILLGINIKSASNVALIIPLTISSVCVFLFAKEYFGKKIGLLAMLLINISDYHILWGSAPQTTTYGICLYYFLLFCIFKTIDSPKPRWISVSLLLIFCLILSHAVSSFIFLITLFGLLFGNVIYGALFDKHRRIFISPTIMLISFVGLIQHWMIALYRKDGTPFFDKMILTFNYYILGGYSGFLNRPESIAEYANTLPPFCERFLDHLSLTLFLFLSIIGCLIWLSKECRNNLNFSLIICVSLLLGITFGFPLFGLRNIIPDRWFIFEYFFLSIMASVGFLRLSKLIPNQNHLKIFTFFIFFSLSFFMSSSTISNSDSPSWLEESTVSESFTLQEIQAGERLADYSTNIVSDSKYSFNFLDLWLGVKKPPFSIENIETNDNLNDTIYIWRKYTLYRPIKVTRSLNNTYNSVYSKMIYEDKILGISFFRNLESHNKIYDNCDVSAYHLANGT
ncbi:glycosyltransferase family protein [Methanosarcina siciliae]|nr:glycosyltransferase family 39 protein [Methanosarcina siciliae]